jgi:hypothetical protein
MQTDPPIDPQHLALVEGAGLIALGVALVALGFALVWAMIRVSHREPSSLVTVTLGLLTLVALGAFVLTSSEILGTIAATGVGALAGAVSNLFDHGRKPDEPPVS